MIAHDLEINIAAPNPAVWDYVGDMSNWASAMPGYRSFELLDGRDSRWVLKVGVGALVKTVKVVVNIDTWDGPGHVAFTYRLENDPVDGSGTYRATARADGTTDVALHVVINGQGPMAPAWEAMARPILPKFAKSFAETLKARIEEIATEAMGASSPLSRPDPADSAPVSSPVRKSLATRLWLWLRGWFGPSAQPG